MTLGDKDTIQELIDGLERALDLWDAIQKRKAELAKAERKGPQVVIPVGGALFDSLRVGSVFTRKGIKYTVGAKLLDVIVCPSLYNTGKAEVFRRDEFETYPADFTLVSRAEPVEVQSEPEPEKSCGTCCYLPGKTWQCDSCRDHDKWVQSEPEALKNCTTCLHEDADLDDEPCVSCHGRDLWEPVPATPEPLKNCCTCKHYAAPIADRPCYGCLLTVGKQRWEPVPATPTPPIGGALFDALRVGSVIRWLGDTYPVLAKALNMLVVPSINNNTEAFCLTRSRMESYPDNFALVSHPEPVPLTNQVRLGDRLRRPDGSVTDRIGTITALRCYSAEEGGVTIVYWSDCDGWEIAPKEDDPDIVTLA